MRGSSIIEEFVQRIEAATMLDRPAHLLSTVLRRIIRPGIVEDALSGTRAGHPAHPALVAVPIGAWTSVMALDAGGNRDAAKKLVAVGLVAALPAAATGASDWLSTQGAERRVGFVHALANYSAMIAYAASWYARHSGRPRAGVVLSSVGAVTLGGAGWLGGHLAFAQGVGVDTTAFQQFPQDWTDALGVDELPGAGEVTHVQVAGIPVLIARQGSDITALADRCTHRGGPLSGGSVVDGCIVCPWHDSAFSLVDGRVMAGPATRPQPVLETRVKGSRIQVRRRDLRSLRTNPTGH